MVAVAVYVGSVEFSPLVMSALLLALLWMRADWSQHPVLVRVAAVGSPVIAFSVAAYAFIWWRCEPWYWCL